MIQKVLVLGGGTAGLLAALALRRKLPQLQVVVVRSPDIGVIGVGESTTPQLRKFFYDYLRLNQKRFYEIVQPTWKIGIHFLWGPRKSFNYTFDPQMDCQWSDLSRPHGFYCKDELANLTINSALMEQHKAFIRQADGSPDVAGFAAFHLYNPWLVKGLEVFAGERGIEFINAKVSGTTLGEQGIRSLILDDGRELTADLFIDASGFRSELLGRTLKTPFVSYADTLFNDRTIVGSWERGPEDFIEPYTIAETMEAGWCWQIDHEHACNRGYVYSSRFISDDEARAEFLRKNPKAKTWDRPIQFASGRYQDAWVKNVFAIGNSSGFVEPLEATALMVASAQIVMMVEVLTHSRLEPGPKAIALYNQTFRESWDHIRDFLAIHYKFNSRIPNKYWTTCMNEVNVRSVQPLIDCYRELGPTALCRHYLNSTFGGKTQFGIEGFLTMLVGQKVPYAEATPVSDAELTLFRQRCADFARQASNGLTVAEALRFVKHPQWQWFSDRTPDPAAAPARTATKPRITRDEQSLVAEFGHT